jgi:hypothetical protein
MFHTCARCGGQYERGSTGSNASWCAPCCRGYMREYSRTHYQPRVRTPRPPRPPIQGPPKPSGPRTAAAQCRWCLATFIHDARRPSVTCGGVCSQALDNQCRKWRAPDRCVIPLCRDCGLGGWVPNGQRKRCDACQLRFDTWRRNACEARRKSAERSGDGDLTWLRLALRDGWACHLCGTKALGSEVPDLHPLRATVDHLVPIAKQGTHTWDNVALAHRRCNLSRGATDLAA